MSFELKDIVNWIPFGDNFTKSLFIFALDLLGQKWAIIVFVIVVVFFKYKGWHIFSSIARRRMAIEMLITRLKHDTYNRTADVAFVVDELNRLTRRNPECEVHVLISGGPGAGKSELARQVGESIFQSENKGFFNLDWSYIFPPTDVITLNAEDFNHLQSSLEEAIDRVERKDPKPMGYDCVGDKETIFVKFYQLRVALRNRSSLTSHPVIIFDNVKDKVEVKDGSMFKFLYEKRENGKKFLDAGSKEHGEIRIIVSVQRRPTMPLRVFAAYKDLSKPMPTDEAVSLLNKITKIDDDDQNAKHLAAALGGLPKSLADAANFIASENPEGSKGSEGLSYRSYLEQLKLNHKKYLRSVQESFDHGKEEGLSYGYSGYMASKMLVEQYFQDPSHGGLYEAIAFFVGYCGSPVISLDLLVKYVGQLSLDKVLRDYSDFEVKILARKTSIYTVQTSNPERCLISTHQITRYASFDAWNETAKDDEKIEASIARIFEVLKSELTSGHDPSVHQVVEYTSLKFKVVDVVMSLITKIREKKLNLYNVIKREFCWVFLDAITEAYLYWPNNRKAAVVMQDVNFLVDIVEESFANDNADVALLLTVLFLHNTGKQEPEKVERIARMSENFARSSLSNTDENSIRKTTTLINMIGTVYRGVDFSKAQELHELALNISEKYNLENEKATSLNLLGIIHHHQRNLEKSQTYHEEAVAIGRLNFSPAENGRLAAFLQYLAIIYNRLYNFRKALETYQESMELVTSAYGSRDQRMARVLNMLSTCYYSLGEYDNGIDAALESLSIHEEIHGDVHPHVADTLCILGFTYRARGDLQKSLEVLDRSLEIMEQYYGGVHYRYAEVLHEISNTERDLNSLEDASKSGKKCLAIFRETLKGNSSAIANSLNSLGLTCLALGDARAARAKFEEALKIFEKLKEQGPQEVGTSETLRNIAMVWKHRGETAKAKEYLSRALSDILKVYHETHPRVRKLREIERELSDDESDEENL